MRFRLACGTVCALANVRAHSCRCPSGAKHRSTDMARCSVFASVKNFPAPGALRQHCLNFFPEPQGQGSFLPILVFPDVGDMFAARLSGGPDRDARRRLAEWLRGSVVLIVPGGGRRRSKSVGNAFRKPSMPVHSVVLGNLNARNPDRALWGVESVVVVER